MNRIRQQNINTTEYWDAEWGRRDPELIERFTMVAELLRRVGAKKVLDVGCGDGGCYGHFKRAAWDCDYYGTDHSAVAIEKAKAAEPDAHFALADVYAQPFDDASFDAVLCQEVLEHVERPADLAAELARLTRPAGHIILTTPEGDHLNGSEEHVWAYEREDIKIFFPTPDEGQGEMRFGFDVRFLKRGMLFPGLIIAVIKKL
jgi:2-polyprenyl-3-methyl-5-hydroxy-6-metoxy-1,4-benzoquinol methylase